MHQQARNVMKHLETKREAAERRRTALMSSGLAQFLEWTSQENESNGGKNLPPDEYLEDENFGQHNTQAASETLPPGLQNDPTKRRDRSQTSILDRIRVTLDRAP